MSSKEEQLVASVEASIAYCFRDKQLLLRAITHRSFLKDHPKDKFGHNERLEFLGDAVLSLVAAEQLSERYEDAGEGFLSQARAAYVCQEHLASTAKAKEMANFLRVSNGMRKGGPVDLPSVLSDLIEAIIGAVYLDAGLEAARPLILRLLGPLPSSAQSQEKDQKTLAQERVQALCGLTPAYVLNYSEGPPHAPIFEMSIVLDGYVLSIGKGQSKKDAAKEAAKKLLEKLSSLSDEEAKQFLMFHHA